MMMNVSGAESLRSGNFSSIISGIADLKETIDAHPLVVVPETPLKTVILQMSQGTKHDTIGSQHSEPTNSAAQRINYALVMESQQLLGIFTERDVVRLSAKGVDFAEVKIADVMTRELVTLRASEFQDAFTVVNLFRQHHIRHLPILDDLSELAGVITAEGLRESLQPTTLLKMRSVSEVMSANAITASPTTSVMEVAQLMTTHQISCVVIVQPEDQAFSSILHPIGIITERDIVQFQTLELNLESLQVQSVMSSPLVCLDPEDSLLEASQAMKQLRVRRLVVADSQGSLAGILTQTNMLAVLNSTEMYSTLEFLQQQVDQLQAEKINLLQTLNAKLEDQVKADVEAIRAYQKRFQATFEQAAVGIAHIQLQGQFICVNQRFCNLVGYSYVELLHKSFSDIIHSADSGLDQKKVQQLIQCEIDSFSREQRYCRQDGSSLWVNVTVSLVTTSSGEPEYLIAVVEDITERKRAEKALFQEKELAQVTLQSIGDAVITTDIHGNINKFNVIAEHLTGWSKIEAKGRFLTDVFQIIHEETREPVQDPVHRALYERRIVGLANHTILISRDGTEYAIEDSAAPIRDRQGQVIGAVLVFHDVTQSRNLTHQLSWQASHDPLTCLVNRRKFDQILHEALCDCSSSGPQHVLCFLDLDQFKVINDTCGHAAGDELLCQVAKLLQKPIRAADTLARLGGDEFGILLHQCPLDRAKIIAEQLRRIIQDFRFLWENKVFGLGVSIGLAQVNSQDSDIEDILGAADAACYTAKAKGRNRIQVYEPNDSALLQQRGNQLWSVRIKQAIEEDRFCLYGQSIIPTVDSIEDKTTACEILLRMINEEGEVISAAEFIPAAEHYNLITDIDRWVVSKFLSDDRTKVRTSEEKVGSPPQFMINLSGGSVGDEQFLQFLKAQLKKHPNSAKQICFEITETAAISNLSQAVGFIQEIKQLGCQFALDDFGTGMSSFAYLKTLPVDYLKIDGHFIEDIVDDPTTSAIVESINHIGHVMGMQTIAEYVSSESIREKLQKIGVDYVQGYSISKPSALKL